jgi:thioredoxin-dependent peroxiredoxin
MLQISDKAPEFKLSDQDGKIRTLKEFKGKKVLVYFYPKDDTPGCTTEACGFRDLRYELADKGVEVIGISKDTVASHKKFADKYELPFILLSDTETTVIDSYGAMQEKSMYGKKYIGIARISYLIDEKGKVEKVYGKVDTKSHASDVLKDIK